MESGWFIALSSASSSPAAGACRMNTGLSLPSIRLCACRPHNTAPFHARIHKQSFITPRPFFILLFTQHKVWTYLCISLSHKCISLLFAYYLVFPLTEVGFSLKSIEESLAFFHSFSSFIVISDPFSHNFIFLLRSDYEGSSWALPLALELFRMDYSQCRSFLSWCWSDSSMSGAVSALSPQCISVSLHAAASHEMSDEISNPPTPPSPHPPTHKTQYRPPVHLDRNLIFSAKPITHG